MKRIEYIKLMACWVVLLMLQFQPLHAQRITLKEATMHLQKVVVKSSRFGKASTSDSRSLFLTLQYNFNTSRSRYKGQGAGKEELNRFKGGFRHNYLSNHFHRGITSIPSDESCQASSSS